MIQQAFMHFNNGQTQLAHEQFEALYANLATLPAEDFRKLGYYFLEQHDQEKARVCFMEHLHYQYDEACLHVYLELIGTNKRCITQLLQLVRMYEQHFSLQTALHVIYSLQALGETGQAYTLAVRTQKQAEQQLERGEVLTKTHIALADFMIQCDVANGFFTQARFQLRKLLYMRQPLVFYERVVYWALVLDLVEPLRQRIDYRTMKANSTPVQEAMLTFYELFAQKRLNPALVLTLADAAITDERLYCKAQAMIQMTNLLQDKSPNTTIVAQLYKKCPSDFFIANLYRIINQPKDTLFWANWLQHFGDLQQAATIYGKKHLTKGKKAPSVEVLFLGGGEKIGGTAIAIKYGRRAVLLDAGMFLQQDDFLTNFALLAQHDLSLAQLDAVFVSHAHLDHTGSLPYIRKVAPHVPIFATKKTQQLMHILLKNVVQHQVRCPYNEHDIALLVRDMRTVRYKETFDVGLWRVTFYEAGHIAGAASIYLEIDGKTILFSGDISVQQQRTCGVFEPINQQVDVLITESTYGYLPFAGQQTRTEEQRQMLALIEKTTASGGSCLIPTFAVGRAQEVLSLLVEAYDGHFPFPVIVDGAVSTVCRLYESAYFTMPKSVIRARSKGRADVRRLLREHPGAVIISSAGMLNEGSQSSFYAYEMIDDPASAIIFTGYLAPQSPAYELYREEATSFKVNGEPWKEVQALLTSFRFSAHVNRDELLEMITKIAPQQVLLMHGEHDKRFIPSYCQQGATIYPTIVDLLNWQHRPVICATNNSIYTV